MSELKTLEEFKKSYREYDDENAWSIFEKLKAEAVKRWKYYRTKLRNLKEDKNDILYHYLCGKMDLIEEMFDLTEEDLKEVEE